MTTGTSPEPPDTLQLWALAQLDLRPDMSNAEARRALFTRLSEMDFMPPNGWDSALRVAGIAHCACGLAGAVFVPARRDMEQALLAEIEAFAAQFFSFPPALRIARHQDLMKQAGGTPALVSRMESLRPGLDLPCDLPAGQSSEVTELLEQTRQLFVLRPQERASRRRAFLNQCHANWPQWQRAAIVVQAKIARVASLETMLFRELCVSSNREKQREKITRRRRRAAQSTRLPRTVSHRSEGSRWWIVAVVAVLLAVVQASSNNPRRYSAPPPTRTSQPWSAQESEHRGELDKILDNIRQEIDQADPQRAARRGERLRGGADRLVPPPKVAHSAPQSPAPLLPQTDGVEIHVAKSPEEARELVRRYQERQSQAHASSPRVEMHSLNLDQARELLRQLREQQMHGGPNNARDAAIKALEQAIKNAPRSSQSQP